MVICGLTVKKFNNPLASRVTNSNAFFLFPTIHSFYKSKFKSLAGMVTYLLKVVSGGLGLYAFK